MQGESDGQHESTASRPASEARAELAPQGHPSWPHEPSHLERMTAWVQRRAGLRAGLRRAKVRAVSVSSRMMGTALGLVALVGLAGIGVSAARGTPLDQGDVAATCVVVALWLGNRALRSRWAARGLYEPPRRRLGKGLAPQRSAARRLARVRRDH